MNDILFKVRYVVISIIFIMITLLACKKDKITSLPVASLTVANAIINGKTVRVGNIISPITNNSWGQLSVKAGEGDLYAWPVGDSMHPYYTKDKFIAEDRGIYSLYLAGQSPDYVGLLLEDKLPYHMDSTCGVRIINLSPNSPALNITLSTTPNINEISNLSYLQYTDFKIYKAKASNSSYIFQIRRASNNLLLFSYVFMPARFTNVTLIIKGLVGSSPSLSILKVNNDRF